MTSLDLSTSDEFALELVRLRPSWSVFPLAWEETDDASLLLLRVVAVGDRWEPPAVARRSRVGKDSGVATLEALDEDPFASGKRAGLFHAAESSRVLIQEAVGADEEMVEDAAGGGEEEMFEDLPDAFVEDIVEGLAEALGLSVGDAFVDEDCLAVDSLGPDVSDEVVDRDSDQELEDSLACGELADSVVPPPGPPPPMFEDIVEAAGEGVPGLDYLVSTAIVDVLGNVSCPVPPWSDFETIGQITHWPKDVPLAKQNVAARCHLHQGAGCKTPARKRQAVSDAHMLRWLFTGGCEPRCTLGRSIELAAAHKREFARVMALTSAAASGSGARSSTDMA